VYDLCHTDKRFKGKLTPILGNEAFFRDDNCDFLGQLGISKDENGTYVEHLKYMHLTMHALDEDAYKTMCRLISAADLRAERHGSERKPLYNWENLEELGSKNITFGSCCLIGMVGAHLFRHNDTITAEKYYQRLRGTVKPGNFYVELFPHVCDRNWGKGVFLKYSDGTQEKFDEGKNLLFLDDKGQETKIKALGLFNDFNKNSLKYLKLVAVMKSRMRGTC
jgi:DNA polymerase III alpha subunit